MSEFGPKFRREPASTRKTALIDAAIAMISEKGVAGATVREIAKRADVTQGLIRHYFSTKEELIGAAYDHHMSQLNEWTAASVNGLEGTAKARLITFVQNSLHAPVMDASSVTLWASFISKIRTDDTMRHIHQKTYYDFRNRLEILIGAALAEAGHIPTAQDLRGMAIACNAVIDGLWIEGGALPDDFEKDELFQIGVKSIGAIIGLHLQETDHKTKGQL